MPVKVTMNSNWASSIESQINKGLAEMAVDIRTRAVILAPRKTSALASSGVVEKISNGYKIQFGSSRVPYARIQELGGTIKPKNKPRLAWKDDSGQWHTAKSVTIKGTHYLKKAGDAVDRSDKSKYFKGKI